MLLEIFDIFANLEALVETQAGARHDTRHGKANKFVPASAPDKLLTQVFIHEGVGTAA